METEIRKVKLGDLLLLDKNARYMKPPQFKQLVANLKKDGCLTSVPLCIPDPPGSDRLRVISGNHRTMAAVEAFGKDADADVMVITSPITSAESLAMQLAHNAISGMDDPAILAELYAELPLALKEYSGLSDDIFKLQELDLNALGIGAQQFEQITILFLPEDAEIFKKVVKSFEKESKPGLKYIARLEDFNRIFDAIVAVKTKLNVHNTALAMRLMAEYALERLDQIESEKPEDGAPETVEA